MANKYMVIARVNGVDYLTRIEAASNLQAEHIILDEGICDRHEYGVEACTAYNSVDMKTDFFTTSALNADRMVDLDTLFDIIDKNNDRIRHADQRENARDTFCEYLELVVATLERVLELTHDMKED